MLGPHAGSELNVQQWPFTHEPLHAAALQVPLHWMVPPQPQAWPLLATHWHFPSLHSGAPAGHGSVFQVPSGSHRLIPVPFGVHCCAPALHMVLELPDPAEPLPACTHVFVLGSQMLDLEQASGPLPSGEQAPPSGMAQTWGVVVHSPLAQRSACSGLQLAPPASKHFWVAATHTRPGSQALVASLPQDSPTVWWVVTGGGGGSLCRAFEMPQMATPARRRPPAIAGINHLGKAAAGGVVAVGASEGESTARRSLASGASTTQGTSGDSPNSSSG